MEIGKINGGMSISTVNTAKDKAVQDDFEKRLISAMDKNDEKELKKVCQDFEAIMLNMLYKQMKATIPKSDLIEEDAGREIFQSMLDDKLIEEASRSKGTGIADTLYKQLSAKYKTLYKINNE